MSMNPNLNSCNKTLHADVTRRGETGDPTLNEDDKGLKYTEG